MTIIFYILKQKFSFVGKILRGKELAPKIVFFAFVALFLLIMAVEFFGFLRAFRTLSAQEFFGEPLTLFVIEEFFLFVFVLIILSATIGGFFIFYKSSDFSLLLSSPLSSFRIFLLKFLETALLSSWPLFLLAGPMILAYGIASDASPFYYILSPLSVVFFATFSSSLASVLSLTAAFMSKRLPRFINFLIIVSALIAVGYLVTITLVPRTEILTRIFQAENLESIVSSTRFVEEEFSQWPSHRLSLVIFLGSSKPSFTYLIIAVQFLFSAVALFFTFYLAKKFYRRLVLEWREGEFWARSNSAYAGKKSRKKSYIFPRYFRGRAGAIIEKDVLSFRRNYQELSRAFFILFLLFVYVIAITAAGRRIGNFYKDYEGLVLTLHLLAMSYFTTTLALRFVFPLISLEGRSAWVLWSSPIDRKKLFLEKFFLASIILFIVMLVFLLATASALGLTAVSLATSGVLLLFLVFTIVGFSLSFGTMFPNFHEKNIDRLTTSTGGLLTTFASLAYGLLMSLLNFKVISAESRPEFWPWFLLAVGISTILIISSLYSGIKRIRRLEVV